MGKRAFALLALAGLMSGAVVAEAPAAQADESTAELSTTASQALYSSDTASETTFTVGAGSAVGAARSAAASSTWTCHAKTNNPHYSNGAHSVIAKTTVSCTGRPATLRIRVETLLGRSTTNNVANMKIVASSAYTQSVEANPLGGPKQTWYVPAEGSGKRIATHAWFRGANSAQAAPPYEPFNIGSSASKFLRVD